MGRKKASNAYLQIAYAVITFLQGEFLLSTGCLRCAHLQVPATSHLF